ncbi:Hypothetical predicted protein, partial [Paramuricea clavata]
RNQVESKNNRRLLRQVSQVNQYLCRNMARHLQLEDIYSGLLNPPVGRRQECAICEISHQCDVSRLNNKVIFNPTKHKT